MIDNTVIGFVVCFQDNDQTKSYMSEINHKNFNEISSRVKNFLYIDRIVIDGQYRKNKLGTKLYENILVFAKQNSLQHLTAEINLLPSINKGSFKFHESFGFQEFAFD